MKNVNPAIRELSDDEIRIKMTPREVKRAYDYLSKQLAGKIQSIVMLDTNNYRSFLSCFTNKEFRYVLTWNEALRLHSYLRFYLDRNKNNKIEITMSQIRHFPVYGLNVVKEF